MPLDPWFSKKFKLLRWFGIAAVVGAIAVVAGTFVMSKNPAAVGQFLLGFLLVVPFLGYATIIPLWHWKERYRGTNSNLWGALMIIETSGWFRLIYWFRHIIPDARRRCRYANPIT